jgi:hypothetical protein
VYWRAVPALEISNCVGYLLIINCFLKSFSVSLIIDNDVKKGEHKIIIKTTILYNTYDDVQNMYHNTNLRLYEQQYITIINDNLSFLDRGRSVTRVIIYANQH